MPTEYGPTVQSLQGAVQDGRAGAITPPDGEDGLGIVTVVHSRPGAERFSAGQAAVDERVSALALLEAQGWRSRTVREALVDASTELRRVAAPTKPPVARTVDRILRDVRTAAGCSSRTYLTAKEYDRFRPEGALTATRLTRRFGSWSAATGAAGVAMTATPRDRSDGKFTNDELVGWVARFVYSSSYLTWALFVRWARATEGAPTPSLVRGRMGTWDAVRQQAITALEHQ